MANLRLEAYRESSKLKIALITYPQPNIETSTLSVFLPNFLDLLQPLCSDIYVITGNFKVDGEKVHLLSIRADHKKQHILIRIFKHIATQLKISAKLAQIIGKVDIVIFFVSGPLLLPILLAKLLRKKVSICATGLSSEGAKYFYKGFARFISHKAYKALECFCFTLADQIAVESKSVAQFHNLSKYQKKISINGALYIDTNLFTVQKDLAKREKLIGYVGRVSAVKGVKNFVKAMPLILKKYSDVRFLIVGEGEQLDEIKRQVKIDGLCDKVTFTGWVPRNELPNFYNQLMLLVFPSHSEGVPGVVQEAMACGTPVLATPVGGIPDLIKDGETGFIMEDNSPESIAKNVIRALEHPNLEKIAKNARKFIKDEYTYEHMMRKCKTALDELVKRKS